MNQIIATDYSEVLSQNLLDYAVSVITDRSLPSCLDGLKPVQRRVLYSISQIAKSDFPHRKCARIVGDTMGKYHPHGDASIYEALVNIAQDFKLKFPYVDGHGNFGSEDGSGAAAMRYTECRLSKIIESLAFEDLRFFKDTFVSNFEETELEPTVLPMKIPALLLSGTHGIAVGMGTHVPTHDLCEIIDATILYLQKQKKITLDDILNVMPGPDFVSGGILNMSREELYDIYRTGSGKMKIRGKFEIEEGLKGGRKAIHIKELPITMIGNGKIKDFIDKIIELSRARVLPDLISDVADRGSEDGECITIELKKSATKEDIENIIAILLKKTCLEESFGVNFCALDGGVPKTMPLLEIFEKFTEFKKYCYDKKYRTLLKEAQDDYEIKLGLLKAVEQIDVIIDVIRGSKNRDIAIKCLTKGICTNIVFRHKEYKPFAEKFSFTQRQAAAILDMRLQRLIGLESELLSTQVGDLEKQIADYKKLLSSEKKMRDLMIKDLEDLKKKFPSKRKTVIEKCPELEIKEQPVEEVKLAVCLDRFFYIKAIDEKVYERNKEQLEEYRYASLCSLDDNICIFGSSGNLYTVKISSLVAAQTKMKKNTKASKGATVSNIIFGKMADKGIQIFELAAMEHDEDILYIGLMSDIVKKKLIFVDKTSLCKIVDGSQFDTARKTMAACAKDARPCLVKPIEINQFVCARTSEGYMIRVSAKDIPVKSKTAAGVKLMLLTKDDYIESCDAGALTAELICKDKTVGFGKIKLLGRGSKGVKMRL